MLRIPSTVKIPNDYDCHNPGGYATDGNHQDHGCVDNQFVGNGVQKFPHRRYNLVSSGNVSIQKIGEGRQDEQRNNKKALARTG